MTLYHLTQLRMGAGSIIEPGNYGRLLKRYTPSNSQGFGIAWMLSRELIFEQLRPEGKPSRQGCSFVLPSMDDVRVYRAETDKFLLQVLHEVEIIDAAMPTHRGAMSFLAMPYDVVFLDPMRQKAMQYWNGDAGEAGRGYELLTASALRVVKALD